MNKNAIATGASFGSPLVPETYYTREQAARYLTIGASTLAKLAMQGKGPRLVRIGRACRYRRSDLDAWMATRARA